MVAALCPMGEVALRPTEYLHTEIELKRLAYDILALGEDTRVVMEATGRYHEPVAAALHEYGIYVCVLNPILINLYGVGDITAVQLIAKIGDVCRFPNRNALVGFAGVNPCVDQSGKHNSRSNPTTKRGSAHLRRTLFQVISAYIKQKSLDEPVYEFLCKKRSEEKPFYVCTTAAANKFLRIYYARVKEALNS